VTSKVRELLGDFLLKEVLTDDWRLLLTPESAHLLLETALIPGKSYRRNGDGELYYTKFNSAFRNRHIDTARVRTYAAKMTTRGADGELEWKDRITDIGLSPDGVLVMGFHTCLAVIASDTTHEVRLLSGFTESERDNEGTGRRQDLGDVLYYYGVPNAKSAASLMQVMANHRRTLSPLNSLTPGTVRSTSAELLAILDSAEMPLVNEAVALGKRVSRRFYSTRGKYHKRSAVAPSMIAHLYLEWIQTHPQEAAGFFWGLDTGRNIAGPVLMLRERFAAVASGAGTPLDHQLNVHTWTASLTGLAWRAYLSGEQLSKLQLSNPPKPLVCEVHHP